jgi:hypothetical protein
VVESAYEPADHSDPGTADPREEGADLRETDRDGFFDFDGVESAALLGATVRCRVGRDGFTDRAASSYPFAAEPDHAVDGEEDRGASGLAERCGACVRR